MEGFGFFQDPDFQKRLQEMAVQMQATQSLAWADNAIKLAVDMTVTAVHRVNVQGPTEEQAQQIRTVPATTLTSSACCTPAPPGVNGTSAATALTPRTSSTFLTEPPTLNDSSSSQNAMNRSAQPPSWTSQTSRR